jgi:Blastomyces yeast-phase-specific protein
MMFSSIITLGSLAVLTAAAPTDFPNAIVNNQCPYGVSVWSNGAGVSYVAGNTSFSEPLTGQAKSLVVEQGEHSPDDLYKDVPKVSFGYTVQGDIVYYDLETVGGGWPQQHIVLAAAGNNCNVIDFPNGANPVPGQDHTRTCTSSADVVLTLCA